MEALQIGHTASLLDQLLIFGEGLEDVGLAQGESDDAVLVVEAHDQVLDLRTVSLSCIFLCSRRVVGIPHRPTIVHPALSLWPGSTLREVAAPESVSDGILLTRARERMRRQGNWTDLDAPLSDVVRDFCSLRPCKRGSDCAAKEKKVSVCKALAFLCDNSGLVGKNLQETHSGCKLEHLVGECRSGSGDAAK